MKPTVAIEISDKDKTGPGQRSAESRLGKFAAKTEGLAKKSGLGKLGEQIDGLTKFRKLNFGFGEAGRSLSSIGQISSAVSGNVSSMTSGLLNFGAAGKGALGEVAEAAGGAAGAIAGTAAAVVGLGVATYMLGDKTAKSAAEVGRTAKTLGVANGWFQRTRAGAERFGVALDTTDASLDGFSSTLYDAKYGANNLALGAMNALGVKMKQTKDGAIDVASAFDDIADAVARQKDPQVQKKLAGIFGLTGMLPALREGSRRLKTEGADYAQSGAAFSDPEIAEALDVNRKSVAMRQKLSAIQKTAGVAAMHLTGAGQDVGLNALKDPKTALSAVTTSARDLVHSGMEAGRHLVEGAREAGRTIGSEFESFVHRIEHRESGGRQFDRRGRPLTSSAGAIGVMQLTPDTARETARQAGIPWDAHRYMNDASYNRELGAARLGYLTQQFGGDEVLAAAAYNAGVGRLTGYRDRRGRHHPGWLQTIGDPRTGQISDEQFAARIPVQETRDYVHDTARAHVTVEFRGAPAGTVASVSSQPGVDVDAHVVRSLVGR